MINKELIDAYTNAKYIADINGKDVVLKVGHNSEEINECLKLHDKTFAYFITPENPFSKQLSANENKLRHNDFVRHLNEISATYLSK